jgi:hypothetical protein
MVNAYIHMEELNHAQKTMSLHSDFIFTMYDIIFIYFHRGTSQKYQ